MFAFSLASKKIRRRGEIGRTPRFIQRAVRLRTRLPNIFYKDYRCVEPTEYPANRIFGFGLDCSSRRIQPLLFAILLGLLGSGTSSKVEHPLNFVQCHGTTESLRPAQQGEYSGLIRLQPRSHPWLKHGRCWERYERIVWCHDFLNSSEQEKSVPHDRTKQTIPGDRTRAASHEYQRQSVEAPCLAFQFRQGPHCTIEEPHYRQRQISRPKCWRVSAPRVGATEVMACGQIEQASKPSWRLNVPCQSHCCNRRD